MKIEEMSPDASYIVCPDNDCELFYKEGHKCEESCPHPEEIERVMKCRVCDNLFEIPLDKKGYLRIDSHVCPDGRTPLIVGCTPVVTTRDVIEGYEERLTRIKENERWKH
jgi:hypothetical protein